MRNPPQNATAGNSLNSAGNTVKSAGDAPDTAGRAAASLAELVTYRTVSSRGAGEGTAEMAEFEAFIAALPRLYPAVTAGPARARRPERARRC